MCGMTDLGVRGMRYIPAGWAGPLYVCRGNNTGQEFYLSRLAEPNYVGEFECDRFHPLYRIRVRPKAMAA